MNKTILLAFICFIIACFSCNSPTTNSSTASSLLDTSTTASDSTDANKVAPAENWRYSIDSSDKMDNSKVAHAMCDADSVIDLQPPYDGGSLVTIQLRHGFQGSGNEAIIYIDKGQFMPSVEDDAAIRVKFDNEKPQSFNYGEASDGSSNYIFIESAKSFITKLKKAKHVIIEAEFYDNGVKQIEFNTDSLKWSY